VAAVSLLIASALHARPVHKQALADYFGPYLSRKLNDCRTCHLPEQPGESKNDLTAEKPHNAFGARLKAVKSELRKAGKKTTIADRLEAIANEDSDGDGVSNILELLSGHYPGDPDDKPTPAEIEEAKKTLVAFRKFKSGYAWRPFEKVQRPPLPQVKNSAWVRNGIDALIAAEHEQHGLTPRPEATKAVLLRRVYVDLIGLPPTPEELHAFLADDSRDAYEQVVDRLLNSPHYGERWGRHWMDIWRYSDWAGWSDGGQIRDSQPHIWRWRDWIIESLNRDKGYDRMIEEMLAGDELAPEDPDTLRATGYLARNYKMLSREKWMQDTVDHTAMAFLGVTLGCARCHDHMYDPILQKEYYQVRAIFEPHNVRIDRVPGHADTVKDGLARVYDANPQVATHLFIRGDDRTPDKTALSPGVPEVLGGSVLKVEPVKFSLTSYTPDKREFVVHETLAASQAEIANSQDALEKSIRDAAIALARAVGANTLSRLPLTQSTLESLQIAQVNAELAKAQYAALSVTIRAEQLEEAGKKDTAEWKQAATAATIAQRKTAVLQNKQQLLTTQKALHGAVGAKPKVEFSQKVKNVERALAKAEADAKLPATTAYTKRTLATYSPVSSGRRLAFARWIANRDNPLTARVAMNHIWLRHFGQAIVPSVSDFGRNGRPPSHPALLDWLAVEFMDCGWSTKAMHRLIVTSNTYRQASTSDPANVAIDRDNKYLWHMPSRRMEAEIVRDCIFYVAGKLEPTLGGREIDYHLGLTTPRRSVYFRHAAEKEMEFLKIFDCAAVTECYQRKESVLPQQALALANSEVTLKHSRLLARELSTKAGSAPEAFTTAVFERVLSRPPTSAELAECVTFLKQRARRAGEKQASAAPSAAGQMPAADPIMRARENLVHVLMNHNDFVTVR